MDIAVLILPIPGMRESWCHAKKNFFFFYAFLCEVPYFSAVSLLY